MAKKTNKTKEKRSGSAGQAGVRVAQFFKKNIYVILMIVCILAIATMITVAVVVNNQGEGEEVLKPLPSGDGDNPTVTPPDVNKPDEPTVTPPDENKPDKPVVKEFVLGSPIDGYTLGQLFSDSELVFDVTNKYWATHEGVDFMAAAGSNVKCMFDGEVKDVTSDGYFGTTVVISHQDGYETVFKLLDEVTLKIGDSVTQGDVIGKVSDSALYETASGPHVHLELYKDGKRVNITEYMLEGDK